MSKPVTVVVDGNNMVAINAHAYPNLTARDGFPTGGMFGTLKMLRLILLQEIPEPVREVIFVLDDGRPAFRRKLCPTYKTKREETRKDRDGGDEFYERYQLQLRTIPRLLLPLGVHVASAAGYEADDLIAGLVLHGGKKPAVICSGDKDLVQLVSKRVRIFKPSQHEFVEERPFGYLLGRCMQGDNSDDIPGIGGVGEKKAADILKWFEENGWKPNPESMARAVEEFGQAFPHHRLLSGGKSKEMDPDRLERLRCNWKVMNLRQTAEAAYKAMSLREGRFSTTRFYKRCKRYAFRSILMEKQRWIGPYKEVGGDRD